MYLNLIIISSKLSIVYHQSKK